MSEYLKRTIVLTGATGFLGSHLMNFLLRDGHQLILPGRGTREKSLEERISRLLKWFGIDRFLDQVKIIEVDYAKPMLGLDIAVYNLICLLTHEVIHCASDTSFTESKRDKVLEFNVEQLQGILRLASDSAAESFSYISTAYASGLNGKICKERLTTAKEFVNVYEESKAMAERVVSDYCKRYSIPLKIIRPSIVYGDSVSGRALKFNAFYYPIRSLLTIRDIYLNDIKNHGGQKSARQGIYLDQDGYLSLPLRFYLPKQGGINLIPVDYFVEVMQTILQRTTKEGIYHLCSDNPSNLDQLAGFIKEFLRIKGVEVIYGEKSRITFRNAVEELFDRFIEPYRTYLSDERIFDRTNTELIAGRIQPPEMTEQIFRTCMKYATEVNWGERIFNDED
jgi:nucleoside-diphosphate-sugar epimerase